MYCGEDAAAAASLTGEVVVIKKSPRSLYLARSPTNDNDAELDARSIPGLNVKVAPIAEDYSKDKWRHFQGLVLFFDEFFSGRGTSESWAYPLYVT